MNSGFRANCLLRAGLRIVVLGILDLDKVVKMMVYDSSYEVRLNHQLV